MISTGDGAGEPSATNCKLAAWILPLLFRVWPFDVTWAVMSASMENPWLFWTTPAATGSKCLRLMLAPKGVADASFSLTGPALPLT